MAKNIYVLDTCVLLHDPQAIYKFAEHDIYIPLAVIDDLDEIKTRRESVGWSAREVFRILDGFNIKEITSKGAKISEKGGKLFIYNSELPSKTDHPNILRTNSDNAIIEACRDLKLKYERKKVIIVTKDTGLRVRAMAWGCQAENYRSDLLEEESYTGIRNVKISTNKDWNILWSGDIQLNLLSEDIQQQLDNLVPNEIVMFMWGDQKVPTIYQQGQLSVLKDKEDETYMGISSNNIEQKCALRLLADNNVSLLSLCGAAGTGKTILSLAVALHKVLIEQTYDRVIIIKPLMPVGGKDIGALPGDKWEKLYSWLGPMRDNIEQLVGLKNNKGIGVSLTLQELVQNEIIEVEAMTYIQGRSIPRSVIIVDEAQNLTPREARMVVERCGKGSKAILLGDLSQVENPFLDSRSCGLAHSMNGGRGLVNCAAVTLSKVERSELAAIASRIFNRPEARR